MAADVKITTPGTDSVNFPSLIDGTYDLGLVIFPVTVKKTEAATPARIMSVPYIVLIIENEANANDRVTVAADTVTADPDREGIKSTTGKWTKSKPNGLTTGAQYRITAVLSHEQAGTDQDFKQHIQN